MTTINTAVRRAAEHLHRLGFNVTTIPVDGKEPTHEWNSKRAPWATQRQPLEVVQSLPFDATRRVSRGCVYPAVETVGFISGINNRRTIDVDALLVDGSKVAVPDDVRETLLRALGLDDDYDWSGASRSGKGKHIIIECAGDLPEAWRGAGKTGEPGVFVFDPLPAYTDAFDHIELRWERCQTVLPSPTAYNGHMPDVPPAVVSMVTLETAISAIATPRGKAAKATKASTTSQVKSQKQPQQHDSIIDQFNARFSCADILERNNYTPVDGGWSHPNASDPTTAGVKAEGDRVRSYSATDPLNDGTHSHDPFSLLQVLECNNDQAAAVKAAAHELGLPPLRTNGHTSATAQANADAPQLPSQIVVQGLHSLGYTFRLNECDNTVEVNGKPIDDVIEAEIFTRAWDAQIKPKGLITPASVTEAARNAYHPVKDYLNGLTWDGIDHIGALADHLSSDDPPVVAPDGTRQPLHTLYLKRWLIGAAAKVLDRRQNMMLVLSGPQNTGKSYLARWLCSGIPDRFIEGPIRVDDKDHSLRLMSRFLWEVSELDATTRRSDVSALKDFITRDEVTVRKAYGRHEVNKPAIASMIGTVNECAGFLSDESGNRRFLVTSITAIDWSYTKIDVNQIWAQAVALYRAGEPWRLLPHEASHQAARNQAYDVESTLDGWLPRWFDLAAGPDALMTASDIVDHLRSKEINLNGNERSQAMELSRVLGRLGVEKERRHGWRGYRGIAPRDVPVSTYPPRVNLSPEVDTQDTASESPCVNRVNRVNLNPIEEENTQDVRENTDDTHSGAGEYAQNNDLYKETDDTVDTVDTRASGSARTRVNLKPKVDTEVVTPRKEVKLPRGWCRTAAGTKNHPLFQYEHVGTREHAGTYVRTTCHTHDSDAIAEAQQLASELEAANVETS